MSTTMSNFTSTNEGELFAMRQFDLFGQFDGSDSANDSRMEEDEPKFLALPEATPYVVCSDALEEFRRRLIQEAECKLQEQVADATTTAKADALLEKFSRAIRHIKHLSAEKLIDRIPYHSNLTADLPLAV